MPLRKRPAPSAARGSCARRSATTPASAPCYSAFGCANWRVHTTQGPQTTATEIIERAESTDNNGASHRREFCGWEPAESILERSAMRPAAIWRKQSAGYRGATEAEATQLAFDCGVEQGAPTYAYASWCLWLLGYPDQALHRDEEALAGRRAHPAQLIPTPAPATGAALSTPIGASGRSPRSAPRRRSPRRKSAASP